MSAIPCDCGRGGICPGCSRSAAKSVRTESLFASLRAIIPPGGEIGYSSLLEALKASGYDTRGIGMELDHLAFRGYRGDWRGSEFVTYRVPFFDRESAGDWTEGELRIVRRELADPDA